MSFLNSVKPNQPVATLEGYFMSLLAPSKFGKTTFVVDLIKAHYKDMSKALFLAPEIGYKTMSGVYALPITTFDEVDEDELEKNPNQRGFIEVVDELIDEKENVPYRFVVIDTITALERYAIEYVIEEANRQDRPSPRYVDISDVPWGKGYNMVGEAIYEQIDRLKKNGFGVFIIGHSKTKKIKNKDGFEYDYTTLNVLQKTSDIIEREADMIIHGDLIVEKGEKDKKDKKSKAPKTKEQRKLRFRSDGNILCGTRFRHFPAELDNDANAFLDAFKKAVLGLYDGSEEAMEEAQQEQEKAPVVPQKSKRAKEIAKKKKQVDAVKEKIAEIVKDFDRDTKLQCAEEFEDLLGVADYRKSNDLEELEEALEFVEELQEKLDEDEDYEEEEYDESDFEDEDEEDSDEDEDSEEDEEEEEDEE
jgi:hypothetical protein